MKKRNSKNSNYSLAHVLYQKLGTDWYAFTEVDGDCFMTKVPAEQVEEVHGAALKHGESLYKGTKKRAKAAA
ncbi:MAG: hypothetical protein M9962_03085 [Oligoflexia bacterium]|nr:hypothetical protein [Oligoflexia bacterium]